LPHPPIRHWLSSLILGVAWAAGLATAQPLTAEPPEPAPDIGATVSPGPTPRLRRNHRHEMALPGPEGRSMDAAPLSASRPQPPITGLPALADKRLRLHVTPSR
jgi:hypothetical protein